MTEIGDRIRERRLAQHLTQSDLAERLGYKSKTTIAKIEAGVNDIPQSKVVSFANALDTTPAYLMGWTDDPYEEEYDYENDPQHRLDEYCGADRHHCQRNSAGERVRVPRRKRFREGPVPDVQAVEHLRRAVPPTCRTRKTRSGRRECRPKKSSCIPADPVVY